MELHHIRLIGFAVGVLIVGLQTVTESSAEKFSNAACSV
jgi:hypothetical protein